MADVNVLAWCPYCHNRRIVCRADGSFIRCWPCRKRCGHIVLPMGSRWTKERHEQIKREVPARLRELESLYAD